MIICKKHSEKLGESETLRSIYTENSKNQKITIQDLF